MKIAHNNINVLRRTNTNYPIEIFNKLQKLYDDYISIQNDQTEPDHLWATSLKYYQYLVRAVMTDPSFGIGTPDNARGLLVYHGMGMGKTRLAAAVTIALWDTRPVVVMLSKSLQDNFLNTVFEVVKLTHPNATEKEIKDLENIAKGKLSFVSMDAYNSAKQVKNKTNNFNGLDNRLLIVDEAHNFFRAIINSSDGNTNARQINDMIMSAKNIRLLFLTGTPASKDPFELVPCFNMLTGTNLLPVHYERFYEYYIDNDTKKIKNREKLSNRLLGLVSHVNPQWKSDPSVSTVKKTREDGWFPEELPLILERVSMSEFQYKKYLLIRDLENNENKNNGTITQSIHTLTAPPLAVPGSSRKMAKSYNIKSRTISTFYREDPSTEIMPVDSLPDSAFTKENSPKLHLIAQRADESPGPVLIYSQFVESGGLKAMGRYLQLLKHTKYMQDPPFEGKGQYAIISGEISDADRNTIVSTFNSIDNIHGEIIKAILISKTGAEGLDLNCIRETHQIEPYWDMARNHQVISRAVRLGSHDKLPAEERIVQPYLYIATKNEEVYANMMEKDREEKTIDELFYERAMEKYALNSEFRKLLTEVCYECNIFKYENCKLCAPTNELLFNSEDYALDLRLPNTCVMRTEVSIEVNEIELDGKKYQYSKDASSPIGYSFYEFNKEVDGHVQLNAVDDVVTKLLNLVTKK